MVGYNRRYELGKWAWAQTPEKVERYLTSGKDEESVDWMVNKPQGHGQESLSLY